LSDRTFHLYVSMFNKKCSRVVLFLSSLDVFGYKQETWRLPYSLQTFTSQETHCLHCVVS